MFMLAPRKNTLHKVRMVMVAINTQCVCGGHNDRILVEYSQCQSRAFGKRIFCTESRLVSGGVYPCARSTTPNIECNEYKLGLSQ